jgi:hypothetical protein
VPQVKVWDIAYEDPSNFEDTFPFVRCPYGTAPSIVDLNDVSINITCVSTK